jgi:hypothetical protein
MTPEAAAYFLIFAVSCLALLGVVCGIVSLLIGARMWWR